MRVSNRNYGKLSALNSKQLHTTVSIGNDNQALDCSKENNESSGLREKRVSLLVNGKVLACGDAYHNQYCLEYFYSGIEELSKSYNECLEMKINLDEEFEESMQKNEEDELSDDTDEFRNNNAIDGLKIYLFYYFYKIIKYT
ncbi:unnamed protein product [Rhizophagus irregularis]|nr:unnamed protein product [Rhizophagus irregularis]